MEKTLPKTTLAVTVLHLFLFQVGWNFERMLNLGFAYSLLPAIKKFYNSSRGRCQVLKRHLEFFNTHPYLASPIVGMVIAEEEKIARKSDVDIQEISQWKIKVMGPLGALGDTLFWVSFRPLFSLVGILVSIGLWESSLIWLGPIIFLIFYNIPHFYFRVLWFLRGYHLGKDVFNLLREFHYSHLVTRAKVIGLFLLGIMWAALGKGWLNFSYTKTVPWFIITGALAGLMGWAIRKKISVTTLFYLLAVGGMLIGFGFYH